PISEDSADRRAGAAAAAPPANPGRRETAPSGPGKDGAWAAWASGQDVVFHLDLNLSREHHTAAMKGVESGMVEARTLAELADSPPRYHELAAALQAYVKKTGTFPQGALPRKTDPERLGDWAPDQRLSFFAELLPYIGSDDYGQLNSDKDKPWDE